MTEVDADHTAALCIEYYIREMPVSDTQQIVAHTYHGIARNKLLSDHVVRLYRTTHLL